MNKALQLWSNRAHASAGERRDLPEQTVDGAVADVTARAARDLGATLRRTSSLNDSPTFISLLESLVRDQL